MLDRWQDILLLVVGAPGAHAVILPTFGDDTKPVTKAVTLRDGMPAKSIEQFRRR